MSRIFCTLRHAAAAAALTAAAIPAAHATTIYTNLASSQDGADPLFGVGPLAQSFTTDANGGGLMSVELLLTSGSAAFAGTLNVNLLADSSTAPGAVVISLGSIDNASISTVDAEVYSFAPVAGISLSPNTTYWVEIDESTPNAIEWSYSYDLTALGVAGQSASSGEFGVNPASSYGAYQMQVDVPEPVTATVLLSGLLGLAGLRRRRR